MLQHNKVPARVRDGVVPEPGEPLTARFYEPDGSRISFARADVTYLK